MSHHKHSIKGKIEYLVLQENIKITNNKIN